ncbi:phosphatase PAP2 family protein [Streptomyces spectabilis]|uniref:phosphatase PAP2 family protein n=1 Tax=Streptomyces spectabilis TaxID=68270 RepID=UPI0033D03651
MKESEQAIWERANNTLRAGAVTVNDFRRIVGLPWVEGGDVFLRPAGLGRTEMVEVLLRNGAVPRHGHPQILAADLPDRLWPMTASSDPHHQCAPTSQGNRPPVPGRPTVHLVLLAVGALLFALLTWQIAADGPVRRLDERLGRALSGALLPRPLAEFFADLGNMAVALPVLAAALAYTAWRGRRAGTHRWWLPPLLAALAMAAVPALVVPLKAAVDRGAPPGMDGTGYYPSGHTATATVAYGAATLLLLPCLRAPRALTAVCVLVNLAVGLGLVVRGYHWPADVVASWLLCGGLLGVMSLGRSTRRSSSRTPGC